MHAAAGFLPTDTWIKAIKNGHYNTWPGLTVDAVNKHFPKAIETQKGHLKKQRQNVRSTKEHLEEETSAEEELTRSIAEHHDQNGQRIRDHLHRPNRKVAGPIQQREYIGYGNV